VVWEAKALPQDAVKALLAAIGGIKSLLKNDAARASVLVKPNLCLPHPAKQATASSAEMIEAVCAALVAAGVRKITIADHTLQKTQAFEKAEFRKISEKYPEVKIVLANEQRLYEPVEVPGKVLRQTEVLKIALRSDLVINLATAKHHAATDVSLATKNLMGLIWDRAAFHTKMDLDQAIGDLALAVRPHLNIVDASRVLLTGGPTGPGKILEEGRVFASFDMLAVDAVVASRYNFGEKTLVPGNIGHLRAAYRGGVGEISADRIQVEKAAAVPQ
jgi:uncharacterized protein (DUF362 family)